MLYVGIDVSARRGCDVALVDDMRRVQGLWKAPTLDSLVDSLDRHLAADGTGLVAAVDAPQCRSDSPLRDPHVRAGLAVPPPSGRYTRYRVCDYELARRGMPLYLLPEPGQPAPAWMELGFAIFERLNLHRGLRLPGDAGDQAATLLEVYPYSSFVTLLGGRPPRKTTPGGAEMRLRALHAAGLHDLPARTLSHDDIDALAAAHTAWAFHHGRGCAVGLPREGLIALPVPYSELEDRYRTLPEHETNGLYQGLRDGW